MRFAAVALAVLASCMQSGLVPCGELLCPVGSSCNLGACVDTGRLDACASSVDSEPCMFAGVTGTCEGGICNSQVCGDGVINAPEQCEGANLNGATCLTFGYYEPAGLACDATCRVDTSGCIGACGDQVTNGPELCDTTSGDTFTCFEVGFDYGAVACSPALCAPTYDGCATIGWKAFDHKLDYPPEMWSPRQGETYLVGFDFQYLVVTDAANIEVPTPLACGRAGSIWASLDQQVFVGGDLGVCRHAGGTWTEFLMPAGIAASGIVWGSSATDVYLTGAALRHFDGQSWTIVPTPAPANATFDRIYGRNGVIAVTAGDHVLRSQGGVWTYELVVAGATLASPWISPDGTTYVVANERLYRRTGGAWTPLPQLPSGDTVRKIWGISNTAIYAYSSIGNTWVLVGTTWVPVDAPNSEANFSGGPEHLTAVSGYMYFYESRGYHWTPIVPITAPTALWAFGYDDVIAIKDLTAHHINGLTVTNRALPDNVEDLWGVDRNTLFGLASQSISRFNGTSWSRVGPTLASGQLVALWGESPTRIFAVGYDGSANAVIYLFDGSSLQRVYSTPAGSAFTIVWGSATQGTYAATNNDQRLLHLPPGAQPTQWIEIPTPESQITGVWGDNTQVIVAFASRRIYRYVAGTWEPLLVQNANGPQRLIGSTNDVFAIGGPPFDKSDLVHWDGVTWDQVRLPPSHALDGVNRVFANGSVVVVSGVAGVTMLLRPQ